MFGDNGDFPSGLSSIREKEEMIGHHHQHEFEESSVEDQKSRIRRHAAPRLMSDRGHQPRTRGAVGIMVVGLGGSGGCATLGGMLANRYVEEWRGSRGEVLRPNYNGCITQLGEPKDGHQGVGFREQVSGLADASMAAIGGWDACVTKLGDALLEAQVLDYDLVTQLKEEMNKTKVFRAYYDPSFLPKSNKHKQAMHVLTHKEAPDASEALKAIRADIRYFKWRNGVVGHTTVIWAATPENDSPLCLPHGPLQTAEDLLKAFEQNLKIPPSLVYATAAILEGCSFVMATGCNTCPGLHKLADQNLGIYCLGDTLNQPHTAFHAAAMHSTRAQGLAPQSVLSHDLTRQDTNDSTHLDTHFLQISAKGFLNQPHSIVAHTTAAKATTLAPLFIDVAVWCDFFSRHSWPHENVAKALNYLFLSPSNKHNSSFLHHVQHLRAQALAAVQGKDAAKTVTWKDTKNTSNPNTATTHTPTTNKKKKKRVRIRPEQKTTEWAIPNDSTIICAGLACLDMQLHQATGGMHNGTAETIETFHGEKSIGGGSVSMACRTLARLCHGEPLDENYMEVTPPVVHSVIPLCKIGNDDTGNRLISLLEQCGASCRNVDTKYIRYARNKDPNARTALAVLPIYQDGKRGCFFDAASNATFSPPDLVQMIYNVANNNAFNTSPPLDTTHLSPEDLHYYQIRINQYGKTPAAFLFGYPHLLPNMQGEALAHILSKARNALDQGGIIALDLNGVPPSSSSSPSNTSLRTVASLKADPVIGPALSHIDILHMNEEELVHLTGCIIEDTKDSQIDDEFAIASAVSLFLMCGVGVVAVTRGKKGCFISCNDEERFSKTIMLPNSWIDCTTKLDAMELPDDTVINTNGAGDAFTSGLLIAALLRHTGLTVPVVDADDEKHDDYIPEDEVEDMSEEFEQSLDFTELTGKNASNANTSSSSLSAGNSSSSLNFDMGGSGGGGDTQLTAYKIYMREHYVTLRAQCNDDKKAIFVKCHELWEKEPEDVKEIYEQKLEDEMIAEMEKNQEMSASLQEKMEASMQFDDVFGGGGLDARFDETEQSVEEDEDDEDEDNIYNTNRALNLESAAQFASLVATHHIDTSTRDLNHLDMSALLERAMIYPHGLEEI